MTGLAVADAATARRRATVLVTCIVASDIEERLRYLPCVAMM
jgi:hypothetical protein